MDHILSNQNVVRVSLRMFLLPQNTLISTWQTELPLLCAPTEPTVFCRISKGPLPILESNNLCPCHSSVDRMPLWTCHGRMSKQKEHSRPVSIVGPLQATHANAPFPGWALIAAVKSSGFALMRHNSGLAQQKHAALGSFETLDWPHMQEI